MMDSTGFLSRKHRVLVVDDHPVVRYGYVQLIGQEADMEVCGEAAGVTDALRMAEVQRPDAAIVDISLDGEDGIELIEYIQSRWPAVKILVASNHDEETFAGRVLRAGAKGYICKREPMPKIIEAVRQVLRGEIYLSPHMATSLLQRAAAGKPLTSNPVETLSNRELQVFEMIGQGLNTVQIAEKLQLSPKTVESHRKLIKMKLNLRTAAQLSRAAFQWVQEQS
jgi:DNA-binding NarL/FixJ family response regulator